MDKVRLNKRGPQDRYKEALGLMLNALQPDLIIDVGANVGQFGKLVREVGYKGEILSFEPVSSNFEILKRAAKDDYKWSVENYGVGDYEEKKLINKFTSPSFDSLLSKSEYGGDHFSKAMVEDGQEEINMIVLEDFLEKRNYPLSTRIYLKSDTQGWDYQVLVGANSLNIIGVQVEAITRSIYDDLLYDYIDLLQLLKSNGFYPHDLIPVNWDRDGVAMELDLFAHKPKEIRL